MKMKIMTRGNSKQFDEVDSQMGESNLNFAEVAADKPEDSIVLRRRE